MNYNECVVLLTRHMMTANGQRYNSLRQFCHFSKPPVMYLS